MEPIFGRLFSRLLWCVAAGVMVSFATAEELECQDDMGKAVEEDWRRQEARFGREAGSVEALQAALDPAARPRTTRPFRG